MNVKSEAQGGHHHEVNIKSVDKLSGTRVRVTVEFSDEVVREHESSTTRRFVSAAKIPGFRPGKAPVQMIRERFKDDIKKEVVSHLLEAGLHEALEKTKLQPVSRPQIQLAGQLLEEGKPFEFQAEFEIEPEIELRDYKGVPIKPPTVEVTEEEITQTLEKVRERLAVMEPSLEVKPTKGLFAVIEVDYQLPGENPKKESPKSFTTEVGVGHLLPELDAALLELNVGEQRSVPGKFPDDYSDKALAGKEVTFELKLLELKKKTLPEIDDALASSIKEGNTLENLKQEIHQDILAGKQEDGRRAQRKEIMDYLLSKNTFEVPATMVQEQAQSLISWMEQDLKQRGYPPVQLKEEELKSVQGRAERMVKSSLILKEVAQREKITLDEQRLKARVDSISAQLNRDVEETKKWLSGRGMFNQLKDEVLTDQIFEFLIENAQVASSPSV